MELINLNPQSEQTSLPTQFRDNFGSNAGARSGFYLSIGGTSQNAPIPNDWNFLIETRHLDVNNNHALQIAAGYFQQRLFFRCLANNGNREWLELFHAKNVVEDWKIPTLSANFVNGLAGHQVFRFRKNFVSNSVEFIGCVVSNAAFTNGTSYTIATLPTGYRPASTRRFSCIQGNSAGLGNAWTVTIDSSGNMTIVANGNTVAGNAVVWLEFSMPLI